jgi:hypothetical protein
VMHPSESFSILNIAWLTHVRTLSAPRADVVCYPRRA